jgi:hypothetical protein
MRRFVRMKSRGFVSNRHEPQISAFMTLSVGLDGRNIAVGGDLVVQPFCQLLVLQEPICKQQAKQNQYEWGKIHHMYMITNAYDLKMCYLLCP